MERLDDRVIDQCGESVLERLYAPERQRGEPFDDIRFTHPAIFMVEYSIAQVLKAEGIEPDVVVGASLGEYCAAVLAGLISLEEALDSVVAQAAIFHERCSGGMLAILASHSLYPQLPLLHENTEIASFNYESNFVVAGRVEALNRIHEHLTREGVNSLKLPVRQAFHSELMESAKEQVYQQTGRVVSRKPHTPFISCTTVTALESVSPDYFWDLVRRPIQVSKAIEHLEAQGSHLYLDLGPGGTFANFIKHNPARRASSQAHPLFTPFGRDIEALSAALSAVSTLVGRRKVQGDER
jgi:trans-AT polyketide synthase/acyltransferase/oxidoreductase domain-containing protein